jgi:hypothetical protein
VEQDKNTNLSSEPSALSLRWSSLRSRVLAGDRDLLTKAALVLFVTGAVLIAVVLCAG